MSDFDVKLIGEGELYEVLKSLEYATQQKTLKAILRETSNKTILPYLKAAVPVKSGNLKRSMGNVTGRSKRSAVIFVGPRMSHRATAGGSNEHKGWVANILEFAKGEDRKPEKAKAFKPFSGGAAGPEFFKKVKGIGKRTHLTFTIESRLTPAEVYVTKAIRTVIGRAARRKSKQLGYAEAKGR